LYGDEEKGGRLTAFRIGIAGSAQRIGVLLPTLAAFLRVPLKKTLEITGRYRSRAYDPWWVYGVAREAERPLDSVLVLVEGGRKEGGLRQCC
jgi:hypothetical protein